MSRVIQALALALLLAAVVWWATRPDPSAVEGFARVIDGDSLEVSGVTIRLKGIDAPELRQTCRRGGADYPCGEAVREALSEHLRGRPLACRVAGQDRYRRSLAVCSAGAEDVNAWLVGQGLAVAYRDRNYAREEARARVLRRGLWAGEFQRPSDWRRDRADG